MIAEKLLRLLDLVKTQVFYVQKVAKVIVIGKLKHFLLAAFYIVLPYYKNFNNSQKLTIMSFILSLCQNLFLGIVGY